MEAETELKSADNNHAVLLNGGVVLICGAIRRVNSEFVRCLPHDPDLPNDFRTLRQLRHWIKHQAITYILVEGDDELFNQYGVILVDPARHPRVRAAEGQAFIDWILGEEGQRAIAGYRLDGQQLFFPNAGR